MLLSQKLRIRRTLIGSLDKQGVSHKQSKAVKREFSLQGIMTRQGNDSWLRGHD